MTKYTLNELLGTFSELQKIDISEKNPITAYLIARNARKLRPIVEEFSKLREEAQKDEWVSKYQEMLKEDEKKANETYKEQIEAFEKELKDKVEEEVEFTFYTRKIEDVDFTGTEVVKFYNLIQEEQQ